MRYHDLVILSPYPATIFLPKMSSAFYVCCIFLSALLTKFVHVANDQTVVDAYCLQYKLPDERSRRHYCIVLNGGLRLKMNMTLNVRLGVCELSRPVPALPSPSQHTISRQYQTISETPYKWRFAGVLVVACHRTKNMGTPSF